MAAKTAPSPVHPKAAAPAQPAAPAAQNGSPSLATGHPRARSAIGQFFALSTSWSFLSQGIIPRNRLPTSSIPWVSPRLSKALY